MDHAPPLPHCPEIRHKPIHPKDKPEQCDRDDLEIAAWTIGEFGTKRQVAKACKALRKILKEITDE